MIASKVRMAAVGLATAALAVTGFGAPSAAASADGAPEQWRSYWVDAFNQGIYTPEQVDQLVEDAKKVNANALIVQTVRRYDCFCNNSSYPRTGAGGVAPAPYDPLAEIIDAAHAEGIEVHAWVNISTMWNSSNAPSDPDHVFNQHGPSAEGADRWLNKQHDGDELQGANSFIDPANPAVVDYIVDGIRSISENYDVDGFNLDYVRYPDYNSSTATSDWGYSDTSIARFQEATGRTDVPEPSDAEFSDWRRDQITKLVRKINVTMYDVDPADRLSIDGITYGYGPQTVGGWEKTRTYREVMQDWKSWLSEGIVDTVTAMNYKRDFLFDEGNNQNQMFDEWTEFLADNQAERQAVNGPALYLNPLENTLDQLEDTVTPSAAGNTLAGWSGYSYANPDADALGGTWDERSAARDALAEALTGEGGYFEEDAAVPAMPWKDAKGNAAGTLTVGGEPVDQAEVTLRPLGPGKAVTHTTDGAGWFGFVDLEPGYYLLKSKAAKAPAVVEVTGGETAKVMFR